MPSSKLRQGTRYLIIVLFAILSCKKTDPVVAVPKNTPPVAIAGPDAKIQLPEQRFLQLDGTSSYDPDGPRNSISYSWRKLSGPEVQNYTAQLATASMMIMDSGTYIFELQVKDLQSQVGRDTVTITAVWGTSCGGSGATMFNSSYVLDATLGEDIPVDVSVSSGYGKLVFAGGRTNQDDGWGGSDEYSSNFFIYDLDRKTTFKKELSLARARIGVAVGADEIFFAGGILLNNVTDAVDVYDQRSGSLSTAKLSAPRSSVSCGIVGNKVFFAGGRHKSNTTTDVVDIYDMDTKAWTVSKLSIPRADISVISSGTKVYFAGGDIGFGVPTGRVDIYDLNTGQWSVLDLGIPRSDISSALIGNNVIFAGGQDAGKSKMIYQAEILDLNSMAVTADCLGDGSMYYMVHGSNILSAVINGREYYYLSGSLLNRFDASSKNWSLSVLPQSTYWVGLVSNGASLFAISSAMDNMSNGYVSKISIHRVSF